MIRDETVLEKTVSKIKLLYYESQLAWDTNTHKLNSNWADKLLVVKNYVIKWPSHTNQAKIVWQKREERVKMLRKNVSQIWSTAQISYGQNFYSILIK